MPRIRRITAMALLVAAALSVTGCIVYKGYHQWGYEPKIGPLKSPKYEVLGEAEEKVSCFTLLWVWTVTKDPDYDMAIREMISEKGGDDVIDVSFWAETQHWLLGTVKIMHIKGKVIRYIYD